MRYRYSTIFLPLLSFFTGCSCSGFDALTCPRVYCATAEKRGPLDDGSVTRTLIIPWPDSGARTLKITDFLSFFAAGPRHSVSPDTSFAPPTRLTLISISGTSIADDAVTVNSTISPGFIRSAVRPGCVGVMRTCTGESGFPEGPARHNERGRRKNTKRVRNLICLRLAVMVFILSRYVPSIIPQGEKCFQLKKRGGGSAPPRLFFNPSRTSHSLCPQHMFQELTRSYRGKRVVLWPDSTRFPVRGRIPDAVDRHIFSVRCA